MKKQIITTITIALLLIGIVPGAAAASPGMSNFTRVHTYQSGRFTDVTSSKWYASYVQTAYEYGLVNGKSPSVYDPDASLTIAEAVKLAVCLHNIYYPGSAAVTNSATLPAGSPWYKSYTDTALQTGITKTEYPDYTVPISRSEFALIMARALPDEALNVKNTVDDGAILDVSADSAYCDAVYKLYRAGILTGVDKNGSFLPDDTIRRSEVAAIVTRMANDSFRKSLILKLELTPTQIYEKCAPAVFYIEISDRNETKTKTGSGFFISDSGLAVTNYHVIVGASSAVIMTNDGKAYPVTGIYGYDKSLDLALIQVGGSGFPSLELADSSSLTIGENAYAIGSPLGYQDTLSTGIISGIGRQIEGKTFIQTTAAISPGSSGGALLNSAGKVVGITTAMANGGQLIGLAAPSNDIRKLDRTNLVPLPSILPATTYYTDRYPVPDFGAFAGAPVYKVEKTDENTVSYYYNLNDFSKSVAEAFQGYVGLLEENNFGFYGYTIEEGSIITYYMNGIYGKLLTIGEKELEGTPCVRLQIINLS
jgi:hypothetical protein